jgi:hypothetical protein
MNFDNKDFCHSQYIFSMLLFVKNRGLFKTDSDVHKFNTRCNYDLHLSTAKLQYFKMEFVLWYKNL